MLIFGKIKLVLEEESYKKIFFTNFQKIVAPKTFFCQFSLVLPVWIRIRIRNQRIRIKLAEYGSGSTKLLNTVFLINHIAMFALQFANLTLNLKVGNVQQFNQGAGASSAFIERSFGHKNLIQQSALAAEILIPMKSSAQHFQIKVLMSNKGFVESMGFNFNLINLDNFVLQLKNWA